MGAGSYSNPKETLKRYVYQPLKPFNNFQCHSYYLQFQNGNQATTVGHRNQTLQYEINRSTHHSLVTRTAHSRSACHNGEREGTRQWSWRDADENEKGAYRRQKMQCSWKEVRKARSPPLTVDGTTHTLYSLAPVFKAKLNC